MYKKTLITLSVALFVFISCDRKPFVEHKLKFEKASNGCNITPQSFKMTSNFGGERYQFDRCLSAGFTEAQMTTTRKGDTVVVKFEKPGETNPTAIFNITLDIDSYPKYNYITIDEDTYAIVAAN
jgi:hypothetical protein